MAGEQQRHHLVAHLRVGEAAAVFLVAREQQDRQHVAAHRCRARGPRGSGGRRPRRAASPRAHPAGGAAAATRSRAGAASVRFATCARIAELEPARDLLGVAADVGAEHRLARDRERHLHHLVRRDRCAGRCASAAICARVSATIVSPYAASRFGANAGASSLRWRLWGSPSAVSRPSPSSGFRNWRPADFVNAVGLGRRAPRARGRHR